MRKDISMLKIPIDKVNTGDVLAREVCMSNGTVILPAETVIRDDYLDKLKEMNISNVYIKRMLDSDNQRNGIKMEKSLEEQIKEHCQDNVRTTMEKFCSCGNVELNSIMNTAKEIMSDVLSCKELIYNISGIRERSEGIYSHSINVAALSILIALRMKIPQKKIKEDIAVGALLHDIGISFLPDSLKDCILEECAPEKRREIMKHVLNGYTALSEENWLSAGAKDIVLSHHEMCDGSGYPMHLTENRINQEVKIVTVCDTFDSMVYGNYVRKSKVHETIDYIVSQAGVKFDFRTVQVFMDSVAAYPLGTYVVLNNGDICVVTGQNRKIPMRPLLRVMRLEDGTVPAEEMHRDLSTELTLFIRDTIE